jgi:transposase
MDEEAPRREYPSREVFNGLRWMVRAGASWRMMPHDLPPYYVVYQQTQRWLKARVFEALVHDLRAILRIASERKEKPAAAIFDSRTLQSTVESGGGPATTERNVAKAIKFISRLTLWGTCWLCVSRPLMSRIAPKSASLLHGYRLKPERRLRSPMLIKATQARMPPTLRQSMESNSKSSNSRRQRKDLFFYHADG